MNWADNKPLSTFALKRYRLFTILRLLRRVLYLHNRGYRDEMYTVIGDVLFDLGGVYVKFLQGAILQSWMMQRWHDASKLDIFAKIKAQDLDVKQIIKANLGESGQRLKRLQTKPFAVGSFGHVYKAYLDNKQAVIVKILSPDIRKTLKFDLRLLKFFWYFHSRTTTFNKSFDLKSIFKEFKNQTLSEINYKAEVAFANQQYMTYKNHRHLVIPKTYLELCTEEVIVQEYIEGISVANILKRKENNPKFKLEAFVKKELNSDIRQQLEYLAIELLWGIFHHPFIMGDPHPGNVILQRDNKIALIDFGIKAKSSQNPAAFLKFIIAYHTLCKGKFKPQEIFLSCLQFFGHDLYVALSKLNNLLPETSHKVDLNQELAKLAEKFFRRELREIDIQKMLIENPKALVIFDRLANKNNRFGFHLKLHDAEMLRSLVTFTGLTDLLGLYHAVMEPAFAKTIRKVKRVYPDLQSLSYTTISHSQALNIVFGWLERVAAADPGLFKALIVKTHIGRTPALIRSPANKPAID